MGVTPRTSAPSEELDLEWDMYPFEGCETEATHTSLDSGRKGDTYRGRDYLRCGPGFWSPESGSALEMVFSSGKNRHDATRSFVQVTPPPLTIRHGSRSIIGLSLEWDTSNGYGERRRRKNGGKPGDFQRMQVGQSDQGGGGKSWKEENLYVSSHSNVEHTFLVWDRGRQFLIKKEILF